MPGSLVPLWFHASEFPENVRRSLLHSLRSRHLNQKFLYRTARQAQKWMAVHRAFSPYCTDPRVADIYTQASLAAASYFVERPAHLIGLACGHGAKEVGILQHLARNATERFYTAADISPALLLMGREASGKQIPAGNVFPIVCDLREVENVAELLEFGPALEAPRLVSLFNIVGNLEPSEILPRLGSVLRSGDVGLVSANLAPGVDYSQGVQTVLPLYDNEPTRGWLMTFLLDLGVEHGDGELLITSEVTRDSGLRRIVADFTFRRDRCLDLDDDEVRFSAGDALRLFFSYRYMPKIFAEVLERFALRVVDQWIAPAQDEGVFLIVSSKA